MDFFNTLVTYLRSCHIHYIHYDKNPHWAWF